MPWFFWVGLWGLLGLAGVEVLDRERTTPVATWLEVVLIGFGPLTLGYAAAYALSDGFTRWL